LLGALQKSNQLSKTVRKATRPKQLKATKPKLNKLILWICGAYSVILLIGYAPFCVLNLTPGEESHP
jgi:hypothetical protein